MSSQPSMILPYLLRALRQSSSIPTTFPGWSLEGSSSACSLWRHRSPCGEVCRDGVLLVCCWGARCTSKVCMERRVDAGQASKCGHKFPQPALFLIAIAYCRTRLLWADSLDHPAPGQAGSGGSVEVKVDCNEKTMTCDGGIVCYQSEFTEEKRH